MKLKIGTRQSNLARAQTQLVISRLKSLTPGLEVEMFPMSSKGDRVRDEHDQKVSDKKEWVIDLEDALQQGIVDVAVHSGKDVPYDIDPGTTLTSVLERGSPADVFIGRRLDDSEASRIGLADLSGDSVIGTSSLRRAAQLRNLFSQVEIMEVRGNVETRLRKLDEGDDFDGIVLAESGLQRIGLEQLNYQSFDVSEFIPAVNQGTLVAQHLKERSDLAELLAPAVIADVQTAFLAERACIEALEADCNSMVGVFGRIAVAGELTLSAVVLDATGVKRLAFQQAGPCAAAEQIGTQVAEKLRASGAIELLRG